MPVVPVTGEVETEGWRTKASLSKVNARPHLKNNLKTKALEARIMC
jgi:hypothetical protein